MATFLKAGTVSVISSLFDYGVTFFLIRFQGMAIVLAGIIGTVSGGILNFSLGRSWVFGSETDAIIRQAKRYAVVWIGNLLLNAAGLYLLTAGLGIHYVPAKITASLMVAICYNYPLQKNYVFKVN